MGTFVHALEAETGKVVWTNSGSGQDFLLQPHSSPAFAGVAPQGYLLATEDKLLVAGGRSVPAAYDRRTGRLLYHWHGGTLTRQVQGLLELAPRLEIAVNPVDARRLGVETGAPLRVVSRRGELSGWAYLTEAVKPGAVFVPFVKLGDSAANFLTNSACDPSAKIPEYKVCAVRVERLTASSPRREGAKG